MKNFAWIAAAQGLGSKRMGPMKAPSILESQGLLQLFNAHWAEKIVHPDMSVNNFEFSECIEKINQFNSKLYHAVHNTLKEQKFPIIVGGDHTVAMATWAAVRDYVQKPFALLWIDAHLDANTPLTSRSMAIHGMPVATLLGQNLNMNVGKNTPALLPAHLLYFGVRSKDVAENEFIISKQVISYEMPEIVQKGARKALHEAVDKIKNLNIPFGISIDCDAFDPIDAPGVSAPAKEGLIFNEIKDELRGIVYHPLCIALEVVEFNPDFDREGRTLHLIKELFQTLLEQP